MTAFAEVRVGDNRETLRSIPDNHFDSIVTDPPYGLSFMGKGWDHAVPGVDFWREFLRVAKPGAHLLAFGGTRKFHRLAVAIEDAGWELRDTIGWVYGSGFPKSHDVSKAFDREAGAVREKIKVAPRAATSGTMCGSSESRPWIEASRKNGFHEVAGNVPATEAAKQWEGWGTALKPAWEPIIVARKPLTGTVAANVLEHGCGGLNIDGCRVGEEERYNAPAGNKAGGNSLNMSAVGMPQNAGGRHAVGRWPANIIHDGSEEVLSIFPGEGAKSASRFFYCAKASRADREAGCEEMPEVLSMRYSEKAQGPLPQQTPSKPVAQRNHHPTVKPTDLMRYLCRLVTPPGGLILDPFAGSGSTGVAALAEGFRFFGCELNPEYAAIARTRIEAQGAKNGVV